MAMQKSPRPRKRTQAATTSPEPSTPWVEIAPRPLKVVEAKYHCCICDRNFIHQGTDPLELVPVVYFVNPIYRPEAQRKELGMLCKNCLDCVHGDTSENYTKRLSGIIYWLQQRINTLMTIRDHPRTIPPEEVWITEAAEVLAPVHQNLTDLACATMLPREEIVRRLIRQAKPADLRPDWDEAKG